MQSQITNCYTVGKIFYYITFFLQSQDQISSHYHILFFRQSIFFYRLFEQRLGKWRKFQHIFVNLGRQSTENLKGHAITYSKIYLRSEYCSVSQLVQSKIHYPQKKKIVKMYYLNILTVDYYISCLLYSKMEQLLQN